MVLMVGFNDYCRAQSAHTILVPVVLGPKLESAT